MSVYKSLEYGILISGCSYDDLLAVCEHDDFAYVKTEASKDISDKEGYLPIEGNDSMMYVSFGDVKLPINSFPEPHKDYQNIKAELERLIDGIKISWTIFEVDR